MNESFSQDQTAAAIVFEPRRAAIYAWQWAREHASALLCALFVGAMSLNMLAVITRKSITLDETVMIPSAYYHLAAGNFQLVHDHPPLSKILAALPLLFIQPAELPPREAGEPYSPEAEYAFQRRFWEDNRAQFDLISFWSRVPMIALAAALGVLIFLFARDLFGARAAVFAVALYSLEPTVLAHGRVVQTDVPAAFGYLLVSFTLYRYLGSRSWRRAVWLGIACSVALLAKFSMLIIAPMLAAVLTVLFWRAWRTGHEPKALAVHAAIVACAALIVIHAAYYFHSRPLTAADAHWIAEAFPDRAAAASTMARTLSYVLPTDFVLGVFWQLWHSGEGHAAGLMGMYAKKGWWYYFPVAFALKSTLPFLFLSLASLVWATDQTIRKRDRRFLIFLVPFAIYTVFVMLSPINIGVRYYLPAYPFLFILGGALLDRVIRAKGSAGRAGLAATIVLLVWTGVEAARSYPHYMSYMNQVASGRPHWWYLSDSNVEWGDDVKELAAYLRARGETRVRSAILGGFMTLHFHGVENIDLMFRAPVELPETRYTAIGASFLNGSTVPAHAVDGVLISEQQRVNYFDAYRYRTPEAVFGGSIYLYREHE
jgi:4-amino-4-deoxy-L-arabinose transferase-like glycosyltransferase